jgi:hypothetical protein
MFGVERIRAERARQIEAKGYSPSHDDEHRDEALVWAAVHYLEASTEEARRRPSSARFLTAGVSAWPFGTPGPVPRAQDQDDIRCLEKAGALIAAEIDRRLRARATSAAERAR